MSQEHIHNFLVKPSRFLRQLFHRSPSSLNSGAPLTQTPALSTSYLPTPSPNIPPIQPSFSGAHGFVLYNPQFNDLSLAGSGWFYSTPESLKDLTLFIGLKQLLSCSMPDAFHDSGARYPPPKCHLGTRQEYLAKITDWALGDSDWDQPILWMHGPFGVGKTALAQSCAEALKRQNRLAATLFFSRSNAHRDDPQRVFTSIAYQVAVMCESFSDVIDAQIRKDPALTTKTLSVQFEELLVRPLSHINLAGSGLNGLVVIIDGLDECRGTSEQCEIINIITISARNRTTPFRWFITSRPEDSIIQTMNTDIVSAVSNHLELPVSREIDHEILVYLTDEFEKIRKRHRIAASWPSEEVLTLLIKRTAGLWIYATTILRFINDENSLGPEDQLRIVLAFAKDVPAWVGPENPLAEMDFFYALIMQRVPPKIRTTIQKILLIQSLSQWSTYQVAHVLCLSEEQLRRSCTFIQSVMELRGSDLRSMTTHFYHTSFLDFMNDPERSKEFSIRGDFLIEYRQELLIWLCEVCSRSTDNLHITFPSESVFLNGWSRDRFYRWNLNCFWDLCGIPKHPFDLQAAASFEKLQFRIMLRLLAKRYEHKVDPQAFIDNLPTELRDKIIHQGKCPAPGCMNSTNTWILGHGENVAVAEKRANWLVLKNNYQNTYQYRCLCGSQIESDDDAQSSESAWP